jgi:hypothetical protein
MSDEMSSQRDLFPNLPEQFQFAANHFASIGIIASTWAAFEISLDIAALQLAGVTEKIGLCFTAQVIGPARKIDAYISVARERGATKFMGDLDKFAKDTIGLGERRNRVVHDPWQFQNGSAKRLEATARRKLRLELIEVSHAEITSLMFGIQGHQARFVDLHARILAEVET